MDSYCVNATFSPLSDIELILYPIIYILLCLFICGGNILTIIAVVKNPVLRTIPNLFVVSLAVADLMIGVVVIPLQVLKFLPPLNDILDKSKFFCVFKLASFTLSSSLSVFSMMAIAADRAMYVRYPLKYAIMATSSRVKVFILTGWIINSLMGLVPVFYNNWESCPQCQASIFFKYEYVLYIINPTFAVAVVVPLLCYVYILATARRHGKAIVQNQNCEMRRKYRGDIKLVKLFALVFGIFVVCWIPVVAVLTVAALKHNVDGIVANIATALTILNSGMNFLVYAVKSSDFRSTFKKLLGFHKCSRTRISPRIN